jgi:hypothetical protein
MIGAVAIGRRIKNDTHRIARYAVFDKHSGDIFAGVLTLGIGVISAICRLQHKEVSVMASMKLDSGLPQELGWYPSLNDQHVRVLHAVRRKECIEAGPQRNPYSGYNGGDEKLSSS